MQSKIQEGAAQPPVPVARLAKPARTVVLGSGADLPCEMCGARVVAYHCKRICLRCGFMTGCSEGI